MLAYLHLHDANDSVFELNVYEYVICCFCSAASLIHVWKSPHKFLPANPARTAMYEDACCSLDMNNYTLKQLCSEPHFRNACATFTSYKKNCAQPSLIFIHHSKF